MSNEFDKDNESIPNYFFWAEQSAKAEEDAVMGTDTYLNEIKVDNELTFAQKEPAYTSNVEEQSNRSKQPDKKQKGFLKKVILFIGAAALFGVVAGAGFVGVNTLFQEDTEITNGTTNSAINNENTKISQGKVDATTVTPTNTNQTTDVSGVVEKVMPSIVSITSTVTQTYSDWFGRSYDENAEGSGSGIIVQKSDTELLVVTNNHVVEGAKSINVTFIDDSVVDATVKGTDSTADLTVVSIKISDIKKETLEKIEVATLGESTSVKVGAMAIAIGNALGYGQSVTVGYVSAKDRSVDLEDKTMVLLQTDAAINPGNSGGALLNINGEVIGINSVKYASSDVEGMGYAIPISAAVPIINDLMKKEVISEAEKGYLGIAGQDVTEDVATKYNIPKGVFVNEVSEDGAAKDAGIQANDIITAINDISVESITSLSEKVNSYRIGTELTLTVMRIKDSQYTEMKIKVVLKGSKTLESLDTVQDATTSEQQENPQATPDISQPIQ